MFAVIHFLSHLSGDEDYFDDFINGYTFLSHLSGDEEPIEEGVDLVSFLSHLSGDEVYRVLYIRFT